MKFSKSLFLAFAGLGLFACSNEDVTNGGVEGNATVTVSIKDVISRALELPSTGENGTQLPVEVKSGTITLETGSGSKTIKLSAGDFDDTDKEYTFSQVRNPLKLTVVINNGKKDGLTLAETVNTGLAEPLYAETTEFTRQSETAYTATLQPEHRLARLQFSGIKHVDEDKQCLLKSATLDGLFLNGAVLTEGKTDIKSITATEGEIAESVWNTVTTTWKTDAPVFDVIEDGTTFLTDQTGWPRQTSDQTPKNQCYAYNIIPAGEGETVTTLPKLTLSFSNVTVKDDVIASESTVRFATVKKYKVVGDYSSLGDAGVDILTGEIKTFKAGYIYNINNLIVDDEDMGTTPEGGKDATLTATVSVQPWTLVNGSVEW